MFRTNESKIYRLLSVATDGLQRNERCRDIVSHVNSSKMMVLCYLSVNLVRCCLGFWRTVEVVGCWLLVRWFCSTGAVSDAAETSTASYKLVFPS